MEISLESRGVLVTGASRGIGRAIAKGMAGAGARVAIHYLRNQKMAQDVLSDLPGKGHIMLQAEIGDKEQTRRLAEQAIGRLGRVDILVNNAGIFQEYPVLDLNYEEWCGAWEKTIRTNLSGAAHLSFLMAKHMKEMGGGKIINISSRGAFRGEPDAPAYGASKAGLNSLGQSMAKAFAPFGIMVYTLAPGFVDTDMAAYAMHGDRAKEIRNQSPLQRIASPEEIARTALFLAGEGTDYLTGCILDINGASYLRT
ncbi:MAG: SDR family oxidoreductase [Bacteroidales bacterium]|nr:SDR family oxidoreductase [Bacteroidales bacterium]